MKQKLLMRTALASMLLAAVLFLLAGRWVEATFGYGLPYRWMYVVAHLLSAYGMGVLLRPVVRRRDMLRSHHSVLLDKGPNRWELTAVWAIVAFHLVAAVMYALEFAWFLYEVTFAFWLLKTFFCAFLIYDFLTEDHLALRPAGMLLIVICVAGSPFHLPGNWAFVQWFTVKVVTAAFAIELYCVNKELCTEKKS